MQQRNVIELYGIIQMNSRTSFYILDFNATIQLFFNNGEKFVTKSEFEGIVCGARMF